MVPSAPESAKTFQLSGFQVFFWCPRDKTKTAGAMMFWCRKFLEEELTRAPQKALSIPFLLGVPNQLESTRTPKEVAFEGHDFSFELFQSARNLFSFCQGRHLLSLRIASPPADRRETKAGGAFRREIGKKSVLLAL